MWFLAQVMQYWILDIDKYSYSPLVYGGRLLQIVALFGRAPLNATSPTCVRGLA